MPSSSCVEPERTRLGTTLCLAQDAVDVPPPVVLSKAIGSSHEKHQQQSEKQRPHVSEPMKRVGCMDMYGLSQKSRASPWLQPARCVDAVLGSLRSSLVTAEKATSSRIWCQGNSRVLGAMPRRQIEVSAYHQRQLARLCGGTARG